MNYTSLNDITLTELLNTDERGAFQEIYKRYWKKLYQVAERKVRREIAEEIIQDIFVNLWNNRKTKINNLKYYLFSSVKYGILNQLKKEISENNFAEYALYSLQETDNSTEYTLLLNELSAVIEEGVTQLPEKTQQVFRLSRFELLTTKEIAERLELTEKAIEYHITQALKNLRQHLKDYHFVIFSYFLNCIFERIL